MELHWETDEALEDTMYDQERENARMKKRLVELKVVLIPHPLFIEPLSIIHSIEELLGPVHKFDKVNRFSSHDRSFVEKCITTKKDLISKAIEILENTHNIGTGIRNFKELLIVDINRD